MKTTTKAIILLMFLLSALAVSSQQSFTKSEKDKLESYADANIKQELNYKDIDFIKYESKGKIKIVHFKADNQEIKMITSEYKFNEIMKR